LEKNSAVEKVHSTVT